MQKLRLFSSGAGPPRRPFCLVENAPFLSRCRTAVSAAASPVFLPSRHGCGQSSSSFRFSSVLFLLCFILLTNLAAFLFWPQCSPTSCQHSALGSTSSHVSSSSSPHNMLRASPVSPLLSVSPTFLRFVPCAVSNPRASHSPTQVAYSSCRVASSRLLQNTPPSTSACDEKQISCSPAGRSAARGVLQQLPSSLWSSDFSSVAHVPVPLSFFRSLSFPLPFSPLPVLLYAQALPGSSPATEGTAVKNAAAATATPPRPPATAAAAARIPATAPSTRAAPTQTLATTEAGEPVRKRPRRAEFVSEGAYLGRESSSDGLLLKSSVGAPQGRRLTDADVLPGSATAPAASSSFSLRSLFPFFSSPPSPSPPRSPGSGKSPAAEVGGQKDSSLPSSSSPSSSSSPTSFSSVPSSGAAPRGGGDSGRTEQRETAGAAGAAAAEKTEAARSANGSSSSSDIAAAEGGNGSKPKREGLAASLTNVNMLLLALCLLCCFTLGYFIHVNMIPHLPDSAAAMLTGVVFGLLARLWGASPSENSFLHFDPEFFYFVLLPPIVLEAGFCLNKAAFLYNLGPILLLSILGTLLSTVIIAKVTLQTAHACGLEGPPHELRGFSWVFASLISATDTVATLSIIGSPKFRLDEKGVDLYSILMGESVLNDAVSIALTRSCLRLFFTAEAEAAQRASGADVITDFLAVVVGSLVLGIGIGGCCCFCFRHSKLKKLPEYEVAITMLTAYMAFGVSECLGFSGVVSLFFCGVMLGHFNVHNMSTKSRNSIDTVFKTIALLSEKTVFAYLGVVAAVGVGQRSFNIFFVLIALSACAISRAACVFPMSFISNRFRRKDERIDWRQQVLIWLAGLRGAVAFALAMTIPCSFDFWRAVCRHNKELVVTTTLVLVAITTLGVGSILEYTAVKLGVVQPRRRSLSLHGYGAAAGPSSSSSALLLLEHRQQQEALGEEEGNGDESAAAGREREDEDEGGEEEEVREASPGAPRLLLATSPSAGLRSEQERTAAEELLNARAAPRAESSQEMVAASALQRGPPPTAAGVQQQQQQQPGEAGTAAQRQQQLQQQRLPATTWGPAHPSPSSPEQRWIADASPGRRPTYVRRDETAEAESDMGRRESFQRGHIRSGRFSRYDSVQHQPFNTVLRFLYRLDREFLQPWLGSSTSPSSSIVVADAPCPAESRPDNSGLGSPGAVSPCYYRPDKAAAATSDRNSNTMASPQFHRQAQQ